jgi:hypothetical protein
MPQRSCFAQGVLPCQAYSLLLEWGIVPDSRVFWHLHRGMVDFSHTPRFTVGPVVTQPGHFIHNMDEFKMTVSGLYPMPWSIISLIYPWTQGNEVSRNGSMIAIPTTKIQAIQHLQKPRNTQTYQQSMLESFCFQFNWMVKVLESGE